MSESGHNQPLGVYVSVPFCRAKCSFCNFASGVGTDAAQDRYVDLLEREIRSARLRAADIGAALPERVDTVYFGGGTPSLLTPSQLARVFRALHETFRVDADAEITLEAAPDQIADDTLDQAMRCGVNRVSLGVQSFVDAEATAVGRSHTRASCLAEFVRLRRAGIADVGADLIAGLPLQTAASWQASLDALGEAELTHVSVYMFEIDEDSRLGAEVLRGGVRFHAPEVASESLAAEMYEAACEQLPQLGFGHYEISNFAREGFRSRHNQRYWTRAPYVGFGLDAHSMLAAVQGGSLRFSNTEDLASYGFGARTLPEHIDADAAFEETLFLGLRMLEGLRVADIRETYGPHRVDAVQSNVRELVEEGVMTDAAGRWALTLRGRLVSNEVFGRLLEATAQPA